MRRGYRVVRCECRQVWSDPERGRRDPPATSHRAVDRGAFGEGEATRVAVRAIASCSIVPPAPNDFGTGPAWLGDADWLGDAEPRSCKEGEQGPSCRNGLMAGTGMTRTGRWYSSRPFQHPPSEVQGT